MLQKSNPADVRRDSTASGYYKSLERAGALNGYERTQQRMDVCVADIHAHFPMMGDRQICDTLEGQFGWKLSDPTVCGAL